MTRLFGYVGNNSNNYQTVAWNELTHITYGTIWCPSANSAAIQDAQGLNYSLMTSIQSEAKSVNPNIKFLATITGGNWQQSWEGGHLTAILANSTLRGQLATNLAAIVAQYNLDGIDIDWEGTDINNANYHAFLVALRAALPTGKLISVCMPPAINYQPATDYKYWLNPTTDSPLIDMFEVMSYGETWVNFQAYMQIWFSAGFPVAKMNAGYDSVSNDSLVDDITLIPEKVTWTVAQGIGGQMLWEADTAGAAVYLTTIFNTLNGGISMWLPTAAAPIHWQWQIGTDFNINTHVVPHVTVYDIDGFSTSAATVSALHALGCKVIAYFSFGTYENWRPDAAQFTAAVKGSSNGWPGENWLDIRAALVKTIMTARIALAASKGFDAIEPDNIDGYSNSTGFPLTAQDQLNFNEWIATTVHAAGMSVGLKNDVEQAATLQPYFDWSLNEECYKYSECSSLVAFINANKAVFQVEYSGTGQCSSLNSSHFNSMTRDLNLTAPTDSGYVRTPCIPDTQNTWSGSPPPSGFTHGTSHTASFSVTVTTSGKACQVEIWLTPDGKIKSATTGLTAFTSTGVAQKMVLPVTMPAAGTYQVNKDIYMNGVLIDFTQDTAIIVV